MEEQQQKDVAVFRFGVISDSVTRSQMDCGKQERLLQQKKLTKMMLARWEATTR